VAAISHSTGVLAKGAVAPDPPTYERCVNHLEEVARTQAIGHPPKRANLKHACEEQYKVLRERAIAFLLTTQWAFAEAARLGIDVSEAEANQAYEKLKAAKFPTPAEEQTLFRSTGETKADALLQVRLNLINEKISRKISGSRSQLVSDKEIENFYHQHASEFAPSENRDVRLILTDSEAAAKKAKQEIQSGKSFASVANRTTIEKVGQGNGGQFSGVVRGEHVPPLDRAMFAASPGVLGGPVKSVAGYYIYEVTGVHHTPAQTLAQAKSHIIAALAAPREEQKLKRFAAEFEQRWKQHTECRPGWVVSQCKSTTGTSTGASEEGK
jgi:parvulin-like peptidyl-prolyl isomerase